MVQGGPHAKLSNRLFGVLDVFYEEDAEVLVTCDMKMLWAFRVSRSRLRTSP